MDLQAQKVYSICHLQSAYFFTLRAAEIENQYTGDLSLPNKIEHRAYVTGAIVLSVAFLEAAINEMFYDSRDEFYSKSIKLSPAAKDAMIDVWNKTNTGSSLLKKFNYLLRAAGKEQLKEREPVYEEVDSLVKLKNLLINYIPETFQAEERNDLEKKLAGKFNFNGMAKEGSRFFPDKCLGYGCAVWAIRSVINYADEFMARLGLAPVFAGEFGEMIRIFRRDETDV